MRYHLAAGEESCSTSVGDGLENCRLQHAVEVDTVAVTHAGMGHGLDDVLVVLVALVELVL